MKAIVCRRFGSPDVLELQDVDVPDVNTDEVLVRVHAAAVEPGMWHFMRGEPYLVRLQGQGFFKPKSPIPGREIAGRVERVGKDVTEFLDGDEVFGEIESGAFAEYVAVPEQSLAPKPKNLSFEQAAAVPISGNAALQFLRDAGRLQHGQHVLINGASGGVGTFAVQIAKALGAKVTGVCSTSNVELVRALGADYVFDYTVEDFTQSEHRYDLLIDPVGNRRLSECRRVLTPGGTYVAVGGGGGRWLGPLAHMLRAVAYSPFVSQRFVAIVAQPNKEDLLYLTELIEAGSVTPVLDRSYPLSEGAEAVRYHEGGHARGKVVITM
ncbi:MAG: NAD(P)-dependent alcohol dehydrogenase [Longimicrobiales bacterium]